MNLSSIIMLIFACIVLYGGLFITVNKAVKAGHQNEEELEER
ncbi:MetS family NSS transporter small subunit [Halothermothrix orenii]|nr:MetS family NSS transporter small subunit [Halothermothrix orenii]